MISKDHADLVGSEIDSTERLHLARVDTLEHHQKVSKCRDLIYQRKYAVNSMVVEGILRPESLVLMAVSLLRYIFFSLPWN